MKRFKTIRLRFALWTAGLLALALVIFGAYIYVGLRRSLYQSVDDELRLAAGAASTVVLEDGRITEEEALSISPATATSRSRGISIRLLALDGKMLQATGPHTFASALAPNYQQPYFVTVSEPSANNLIRYYSAPVDQGNVAIGVVQVAQALDQVESTLRQLLLTLALAIPMLVLTAAAGAYFLVGRALRPVDQMTRTARIISASDLSARLNLPATDDEVGRLAATFDDMLARLEASFERERRFLADASHELRTPLTATQAILSVMREQRRAPEDYERALDDLAEVNARMHALVENLLQVARAGSPAALVKERVNLSRLLQDLCETLQPVAQQRGLMLVCACADGIDETCVIGDTDALLRIFVNLIDNAIKYTDHGSVIVRARIVQARKVVQVDVSDTGCGIAPEHLARIFDRFYRADPSRAGAGFGLGLTIVRDIALEHNGKVGVTSEAGKGTTFTVTLPQAGSA